MATVINNPSSESAENGVGLIVGVVIALAVIILAALYLVPALRGDTGAGNPSPALPSGQVDVNLNTGGAGTGGGQ